MVEVIKLFKQIQETSSLNGKKSIIAVNKNNELFKKCLKFLLDGNVITGISDAKISKSVGNDFVLTNDTWEDVMNYLHLHNSGKDEDILYVQRFIINQPEEYKEFYKQIITKTFRLGADAKLVNKCIAGLISTFDVMLGTPIDKVKLKGDEWISISRKLNGTRCSFIGNKCMTRQGKEYRGLDHIINDIKKIGYENHFIDGELLYKNNEGLSDSEAFQKGTGIAMSKDENKQDLKLVVFDLFPLEEFWNGKSRNTYENRRKALNVFDLQLQDICCKNIEVVNQLYAGTDHSQIWKWLDYAEENDWEGIMLNLDTPYECKRTKNLIKVKKFFSCDIKCTGIEEGSGRNKGTLGALVCDYKGNKVNVGSGFSDEDRKRIWQHPEDVIDKIITVKYKEETKNKDGGISIQFPVFEAVRFDKNEPSYN